jgi:hypothetical protein
VLVAEGETFGASARVGVCIPGGKAGDCSGVDTCEGNSDSLPEGVRLGCLGGTPGLETSFAGTVGPSILAVRVCTCGSPWPSSTLLKLPRFSCRVGGLFSGVDGLIRSGMLKGWLDWRLPALNGSEDRGEFRIILARCAFA